MIFLGNLFVKVEVVRVEAAEFLETAHVEDDEPLRLERNQLLGSTLLGEWRLPECARFRRRRGGTRSETLRLNGRQVQFESRCALAAWSSYLQNRDRCYGVPRPIQQLLDEAVTVESLSCASRGLPCFRRRRRLGHLIGHLRRDAGKPAGSLDRHLQSGPHDVILNTQIVGKRPAA